MLLTLSIVKLSVVFLPTRYESWHYEATTSNFIGRTMSLLWLATIYNILHLHKIGDIYVSVRWIADAGRCSCQFMTTRKCMTNEE